MLKEEVDKFEQIVEQVNTYINEYKTDKKIQSLPLVTNKVSELLGQLEIVGMNNVYRTDRLVDKYQEKLLDFENHYQRMKSTEEEKFLNLYKELEEKAEEKFDKIEVLKNNYSKVLEQITDKALEEGYEKAAKHDMIQRIIWQGVAVLGLIGMIWFTIDAFNEALEGGINLYSLIGKIISVGTLGTLATYAAKQAKIFNDNFSINKKMALRLATLNPFLTDFSEEKKQKIKEKLVYELFADDLSFEKTGPFDASSISSKSDQEK